MSSKSQTPSKGPPPLPTLSLPDAPFSAPLGDVAEVEEAFFLEGVDGRADSVPSESEAATIALAPIGAQPSLPEEDAVQADVEDPARARRRRAARIGVVWGAALMLGVAGASAFLRPHAQEQASASPSASVERASPAPPVEKVSSAPVATPSTLLVAATPASEVSPASQPATPVTPARSTVHAMTASAAAVPATHPRGAVHKKGAAPSHGAKASSAPKASSAHASQARAPARRVAAAKPQRRTTIAGAKASG